MNDKITLPVLVNLLALRAGCTKRQSEDFLKAFFKEISASLEAGESVRLKDLGVFKVIDVEARKSVNVSNGEDHEIPAHRKVVFVPSKELASLVNEPFSMFETVELDDETSIIDEPPAINDYTEPVSEEAEIGDEIEVIDVADPVCEDTGDCGEIEVSDVAGSSDCPDAGDSGGEEMTDVNDSVAVHASDCSGSSDCSGHFVDLENSGNTTLSDDSDDSDDTDNSDDTNVYTYPAELDQEDSAMVESRLSDATGSANEENARNDVAAAENACENIVVVKSRFGIGFLWGTVSMALLVLIAFATIHIVHSGYFKDMASEKNAEGKTAQISVVDSDNVTAIGNSQDAGNATMIGYVSDVEQNEAVPTQPSDVNPDQVQPSSAGDGVVYDTITKTRYLTTMAKDHYGNYNLWPYIYEENKAMLGHPDRIKPGTQVVVPDLKKYGVDPNNPDDIAKAKRKGVAIYSRYK